MAAVHYLRLMMFLLFAVLPAPSVANKFVVGDKQNWARDVDYSAWPDKYHFHVGDWLVFNYEKDMYDVVQVNKSGYAACDASNPIVSYSRGRNFVFQLNHTGRYFFICSRGYCWGGMKVTVLVEPRPPPSPPPSTSMRASSTSASHASLAHAAYYGVFWASLGAAVWGLPLAV